MQAYMALFLATPRFHQAVADAAPHTRMFEFFSRFTQWVLNYYTPTQEEFLFFCVPHIAKAAGSEFTFGGSHKETAHSKAARKSREENIEKWTQHFKKLYGINVGLDDMRVFAGCVKPWNNLRSFVMPECHAEVLTTSYDDASLETPLPAKLNADLVPMAIRNRVLQKWRKLHAAPTIIIPKVPLVEDDEPAVAEQTTPILDKYVLDFTEIQRLADEEDW
jgi:hypothetical protein